MTGLALLRTRKGRTYVGHADVRDGCVSMPDARLRHADVRGPRYYPAGSRGWSRSEWTEIRWLDADAEAVAA